MKLAYFDPNSGMVLAWLDTEAYTYGTLPPDDLLIRVTDEQISDDPSEIWYVSGGKLTQTAPSVA